MALHVKLGAQGQLGFLGTNLQRCLHSSESVNAPLCCNDPQYATGTSVLVYSMLTVSAICLLL